MGKQLAGPARAALDLIIDQHQAVLVTQLAQTTQALLGNGTDTALALDGLDADRRCLVGDGGLERFMIAELDLVEPFHRRAETLEVFRIAAGIDGAVGAAMEGTGEGDDAVALRVAIHEVIAARGLQRTFHRLGTGIGEEDPVGKGRLGELVRQFDAGRHLEHVGQVPELASLLGEGGNGLRVSMAQAIHRDARNKVEIPLAITRKQARPLAVIKDQIRRSVGIHHRCGHVLSSWSVRPCLSVGLASPLGRADQLFKRQPACKSA